MKSVVIGAGPAGLAAAYALVRGGCEVVVFEAGPEVGGMARSLQLWGQTVDLGPHRFFTRDKRVAAFWMELVGHDYALVQRQTRILYRGKLFRYPLELTDVLWKLGLSESARCAWSFLQSRAARVSDPETFEDWVVDRFGRRLFEIFFKTYSEKLWGISCGELDADFAAQRIRQFSFAEAIKSMVIPGYRRRHRTLADEFAYPTGGSGMVYCRMAEAVRAGGGVLYVNKPVERVLVLDGRAIGVQTRDGKVFEADHVLSSMPLPDLVRGLEGLGSDVYDAAARLGYRNTILVYLELEGPNPFPDQWVYVHAPELRCGRVTNFRNWVPQLCAGATTTILCMEYWASDSDDLWAASDEELGRLASDEIGRCGLVGDAHRVLRTHVLRLPRAYPVYRRGYRACVDVIRSALDRVRNLQLIGRPGAFKYNNQDHSILMGLLAAENVLHGARHNLWRVNSDFDSYQESGKVRDAFGFGA